MRLSTDRIKELSYHLHRLQERWFDLYHNCNTASDVGVDASLYEADQRSACEDYEASPIGTLDKGLAVLVERGVSLQNLTFVDVGCGKGRVLLEAMKYGFQALEGIDVSSEMAAIAESNLAKARFIPRRSGAAFIYQARAEEVRFRDADTAVYLFHPFSDQIMSLFIGSLTAQLTARGRKVYVLYYNPLCHTRWEAAGFRAIARIDWTPDWTEQHACPLAIYESDAAVNDDAIASANTQQSPRRSGAW